MPRGRIRHGQEGEPLVGENLFYKKSEGKQRVLAKQKGLDPKRVAPEKEEVRQSLIWEKYAAGRGNPKFN